ncbi:MAG: ribosome maturation factor RimP [Candidatus Binatia bacterium]
MSLSRGGSLCPRHGSGSSAEAAARVIADPGGLCYASLLELAVGKWDASPLFHFGAMEIREKIMQLVEPVLEGRGLELVDVEWRREARGAVLRLLVDGADLDQLSKLSRECSDLLDVEESVPGSYTLEVSSPGMNRPLRKPDHFGRYVDKRIRVRTVDAIDGQRNFTGRLRVVSHAGILLDDETGKEVSIPFPLIEKANYEHEFSAADFSKRAG